MVSVPYLWCLSLNYFIICGILLCNFASLPFAFSFLSLMLNGSFCHSPQAAAPQEAQDAVGQGAEQEPEPEGQPVRGGDAAEGDRQDEPVRSACFSLMI